MTRELTKRERAAKRKFVGAVEHLVLDLTPEQVGRIADDVGEYGTDSGGGARVDAAVLECLRVVVDEVSR
jgi:hypothetical protein